MIKTLPPRRRRSSPVPEPPIVKAGESKGSAMDLNEIKRLIQNKARVPEMLASARSDGMTTLVQDGILKSLQGVTDFRQVKAVAIK